MSVMQVKRIKTVFEIRQADIMHSVALRLLAQILDLTSSFIITALSSLEVKDLHYQPGQSPAVRHQRLQ